ncbi:hypothetical protein NADFUDRAFT_84113 [Nadsonia fulvescens var. elongata DSM 6958]|uniref:Homeobox domain-containing protein n=1 Tax=Nadsonia fulvescens var. elongata DSM 6958 TaxID=857566 RepID=A0A1E3PFA0_9ASCO|nr:hypothetical protein NADFUDRAFT_84113 [Nadsonia fulvescens var. elongata DSM 6958]
MTTLPSLSEMILELHQLPYPSLRHSAAFPRLPNFEPELCSAPNRLPTPSSPHPYDPFSFTSASLRPPPPSRALYHDPYATKPAYPLGSSAGRTPKGLPPNAGGDYTTGSMVAPAPLDSSHYSSAFLPQSLPTSPVSQAKRAAPNMALFPHKHSRVPQQVQQPHAPTNNYFSPPTPSSSTSALNFSYPNYVAGPVLPLSPPSSLSMRIGSHNNSNNIHSTPANSGHFSEYTYPPPVVAPVPAPVSVSEVAPLATSTIQNQIPSLSSMGPSLSYNIDSESESEEKLNKDIQIHNDKSKSPILFLNSKRSFTVSSPHDRNFTTKAQSPVMSSPLLPNSSSEASSPSLGSISPSFKRENTRFGVTSGKMIKKRKNLPKLSTNVLLTWLIDHTDRPYPSEYEKNILVQHTGLTLNQVSNWFINARRRILPVIKKQNLNRVSESAVTASS